RSLAHMMLNTKLRIPQGYVILASAWEEENKAAAQAELEALLASLDDQVTYAVRSSALNEDGEVASFAGQYETVTDVRREDIPQAVQQVIASAQNANVQAYVEWQAGQAAEATPRVSQDAQPASQQSPISIVIQHFIHAEFAGVLFTADAITGKDEEMVGNYVHGAGEKLVSGAENAETFRLGAIKFSYDGPAEFAPYAKKLASYGKTIRNLYGMPMDIEWAVAGGKIYILQARPITTLQRANMDTYDINGTRAGYKLLTRTNVGEIFMKPVSPMTYSVLEKINEILGMPQWLDNVCGQPYMNISVMCSIAVAFGKDRQKAYESMKGLVGKAPEGVEVPVSPFDKKAFLKRIWTLFFPKQKSKLTKKQKKEMVRDLADISRGMMDEIRKVESLEALNEYWEGAMLPKLRDGMASVIGQSGTSMLPLFNTRSQIGKIAGEEMAERLCGGCLGVMESMKPLFLISDVISGKITKEEYIKSCGQRCPNEMELMAVHPYEDESYVDRLIEEHRANPVDFYGLQASQRAQYEVALAEFKSKYPSKKRWIDRKIARFVQANSFREDLRSKGVWIFCVFREFIKRAGEISGLGDDIFMMTFDELFAYLKGDAAAAAHVKARRATYEKYQTYEPFPNIILGRFDAEAWMADPARRNDAYIQDVKLDDASDAQVKGFAGAAGEVRGFVRVIKDVEHIGEVQDGDILVTGATNVGWTPVFSKVAAIVTDIGAPLSHAAIIARECGIPAVVGCGNATTVLHTGDEVIVNGTAGTVIVVNEPQTPSPGSISTIGE
ncbi:MAG: hypothetical protein J5546_01465, partial [Lachnospiraceae bacterium]|nr:hypothetical protein [Lachnospiraceae bacterium]